MVPFNTTLCWTRTPESLWKLLSIKDLEIWDNYDRVLCGQRGEASLSVLEIDTPSRSTWGSDTNSDRLPGISANSFLRWFSYFSTLATATSWKGGLQLLHSPLQCSFFHSLITSCQTSVPAAQRKPFYINCELSSYSVTLPKSLPTCAFGISLSILRVYAFWILCPVLFSHLW